MPAFSNAQNLIIQNNQFTENTTNTTNITTGPSGIDILLEVSCHEAAHDAESRENSPRCFPGTREQYIQDIVNWVIPSLGDTPTPMYWMEGPAGVGKSAVAQTCAEELEDRKRLGAAFFFSISGRQKPEKFFPSIAYQLSTSHPPYRDLINNKILNDKTLVKKTLSSQFRHLISEPLRELEAQGKGFGKRTAVIIDGLDECEGPDAQREIIRIIAKAALDGSLPLCWAFFSRPEPHIEGTFAETTISPHCYKVILPISRDADGEIELYFRNGFENIRKRRTASMQSQWPSSEDMELLVSAAGGSFIYATTVLRYVDHVDSLVPQRRLCEIIDTILNRRRDDPHVGTRIDGPFAELDAFYMLILQRIPPAIFSSVHLLLALICHWGGLGAIFAANVLGMLWEEFEAVCSHTSAVVHFEELGKGLELDPSIDTSHSYTQFNRDVRLKFCRQVLDELGGRISFFHKSFSDFLLDPERSGAYCTKRSAALSKHYIKMHLDYDRSFAWKGSELVFAPGVTDSASTLSCPQTSELINSITKHSVYTTFGAEDPKSFSALTGFGASAATCDFRKHLHVSTYLVNEKGSLPWSGITWGCECRSKLYMGTDIRWFSLDKFDITSFKLMVKQLKLVNVIVRYHPNWSSRIKFPFRNKTQEGFESGLYRMGEDEKSIFWYWEINYELRHYKEFRTIDLAKGEKRFRDEDFDAWPAWGEDIESE